MFLVSAVENKASKIYFLSIVTENIAKAVDIMVRHMLQPLAYRLKQGKKTKQYKYVLGYIDQYLLKDD